jgi:phage host-nuclease inhibitor protein Gam
MTVEDEIEQVLSGPEPAYSETPLSALPADQVQAMYYLRRLHRLRAERERVEAMFDKLIEELNETRSTQVDPIKATIAWLEQTLALWHHARLQEDPKALKIMLPSGTLRSSKAQPRWTYDDAAAFLEWAKLNATDVIRLPEVKPEIAKNDVKKLLDPIIQVVDGRAILTKTGEKIPGLKIEPGGDYELGRFYTAEA